MSLYDAATVSGQTTPDTEPILRVSPVGVSYRLQILELAVQTSLQKGDADGQTVLRRANAFLKFVAGSNE